MFHMKHYSIEKDSHGRAWAIESLELSSVRICYNTIRKRGKTMSRQRKSDEERQPKLFTRTMLKGITYDIMTLENGVPKKLETVTLSSPITKAQENEYKRNHSVANCFSIETSREEETLAITVDEFIQIARPVSEFKNNESEDK